MRKFFLLLTMLFCAVISFAQHVPQGMKYQAVARNLSGNVLVNQSITLKINLLTQDSKGSTIYYSETHSVTTNQVGLFTLTIGEGKIETGTFASIPWSSADVWMQVAIKDKGQSDFTTISNSKLLAVPYAFHSETATRLSGDNNTSTGGSTVTTTPTTSTGVPAQVWSLKGNSKTDPATDKLGTTDVADLVLITNNLERIRIMANGDVNIKGVTSIRNVTQSNTITDGAVIVDGGVGIAKNLNVGGQLNVTGRAHFKDSVTFDKNIGISGSLNSSSLNISGDSSGFIANIENKNSGEGDGLKIKLGRIHPLWNGTAYESVQADDFNPVYHAFQDQITLVQGWIKNKKVDISAGDVWSLVKNTGLFLGGALCQLTNAISPTLNSKLGLPLDLATPINTQLSLPFNVSAPINSALKLPFDFTSPINTGLGLPINMPSVTVFPGFSLGLPDPLPNINIAKVTIGGFQLVPKIPSVSIPAIPDLIIPAIPTQYLTIPAIPQIDCSGLPTIGMPTIKTDDVANSLTKKNEFIRFADKDDRMLGMIRAQSIGDFTNYHFSNEYLFHLVSAVGGIDIAKGLLSLASEFNKVAHEYNNLGVEYVSGNGDYAEWMERSNNEESISAGDIVGVKGGKITKDIKGAEQIMAVSTQPIVNANMPDKNRVALGNSIAFMGQIPVKIMGAVSTGDFIVAKGNIPGYGVSVKPSQMTAEDFRLIVGRAWETLNDDGPKMVNTLVGVQNNDFLKIIQKYQQKVEAAEMRVATSEERLSAIEKKLNMNVPVKKSIVKKK